MSFCKLLTEQRAWPQEEKSLFKLALKEALKGVGFTCPNPPVGYVVEKDGKVIATGYHAKAGELHAEAMALKQAGEKARGATLYGTLEPCNHHGRTPPCTQAIIDAGIKRVIFGAWDPDPEVLGGGSKVLRAAGIEVVQVSDTEEFDWARSLILPFETRVLKKRPYVLGKIATSLDGKIAFRAGEQTQITGFEAKIWTHEMREFFDVVGVGANTWRIDKPQLTARFEDREAKRQPEHVIFDSKTSLKTKLEALGEQGVSSIMIEGGGVLLTALLKENLVDEVAWLTAPKMIGQQGVPALGEFPALLDYSKVVYHKQLGIDLLTIVCHKDSLWPI
ncbi:MAG: bifunctional diaminohydroxyphosphoribosylaminopyrimidine deaminase/5-amino-6-(5-phosphoribosylamino)uracil reductase RibD [Deltaproteobacteria bacterium]|nr:bifunctional diaminohydroxyphosphoribosylaminopyrimidine deaminase/5-amino-6-(5-phosphoribosylamino)uracil reductase RibD [Deltaproteobacteria bacterium]